MSVHSTIVNAIVPHVIEFFTKGEVSADEIARIQNFVVSLEDKEIERQAKIYRHAIHTVIEEKFPSLKKPLTFISGSTTIYDIQTNY